MAVHDSASQSTNQVLYAGQVGVNLDGPPRASPTWNLESCRCPALLDQHVPVSVAWAPSQLASRTFLFSLPTR